MAAQTQLLDLVTHPLTPPVHQHLSVNLNPRRISLQTSRNSINRLTHLSLLGNPVSSSTYASILQSCKCPNGGRQVHSHTIKTGFVADGFVVTKLLQMYARLGCIEDAVILFDEMPLRNLYAYTSVISLYAEFELFEKAFTLFEELLVGDIRLEFFVFPVVFKACGGLQMVELGRQLHGLVIKCGFVLNLYVSNAVIDMYGKCGVLDDAKRVFEMMLERDCVSWNCIVTACANNGMVFQALEFLERMYGSDKDGPNLVSWSAVIGGFAQNGFDEEAVEMFRRMQAEGLEPNARTLASVLPACGRLQELNLGKECHGYVTRHGLMDNSFVVNGMVDMYRRCADMGSAFKLFSKFLKKNDISCNTMIVGYCENGNVSDAKELFDRMDELGVEKGLISWNSMISGYVDNFMYNEALSLFKVLKMEDDIQPNSFTLGSVLTACADLGYLKLGKVMHSIAIVLDLQTDAYVGGALVEMYCKCQDLNAAEKAFNEVMEKDTSTWNSIISGYAHCNQVEKVEHLLKMMKGDGFEPNLYTWNGIIAGYIENGDHDKALQIFTRMQTSNSIPDVYSIGMILSVCSSLATIERGKQVHAQSIRCGYDEDMHVRVAIVDMYAKCGSLKLALSAYRRIRNPDLVSRNTMLTAYAMHGHGEEGIKHFQRMLADGIRPDEVSFLSVLSACVHAGSVETGHEVFNLMGYYNVKPSLKHYTCMVDLLSRAGQLDEAYETIKRISMKLDSVIWGALLAGCVIHGNVELGQTAAEKLIELEPNNSGNYVMMANLYAYAGRWHDLAITRQTIKHRRMHKTPGCSWIEDREGIHEFLASDRSHERTEEIYTTLDHLTLDIKSQLEKNVK